MQIIKEVIKSETEGFLDLQSGSAGGRYLPQTGK
jgi:hypothetical protein